MHVEHKWIPLPRVVPFDVAIARNIAPGSTAGLPGLVPACRVDLGWPPVAVELDAAAGTDRALLGLGTSLAQVLGPIPPLRFTVSTALAT
jgi:mandelamide amidase